MTANESTNYSVGGFNTENLAVVLKVPPGRIVGMINDMWQQSPADVGAFGYNAGRGGTHIIIGPNTPKNQQSLSLAVYLMISMYTN